MTEQKSTHLDIQENLPLFCAVGFSDTAKIHIHATLQFALAESQARIKNLL